MNWGKVTYTFFALMSLTTTAGFIYEPTSIAITIAATVNIISTILKIGVRHTLETGLLASSFVADLHLIPSLIVLIFYNDIYLSIALAIGAIVANLYSITLVLIESAQNKDDEVEY